MFGKQHLTSLLPLRLPHWRLNRVTEMLRHRPQPLRPRREDDHPIRAYRWMLLALSAAGNDEQKRAAVQEELPAVYEAHRYHYSPDFRRRQEIEARLLTRQSLAEIAAKLGADPKAIEYYASIFFDVRDALDHRDWVLLTIRNRVRYDEASGGNRAEAEQGYVKRLFAYFGGPLVLDTLVNPTGGARRPENAEQRRVWFEDVFTKTVGTAGTAAAAGFEVSAKNHLQLIRLAARQLRGLNTQPDPNAGILAERLNAVLAGLVVLGIC